MILEIRSNQDVFQPCITGGRNMKVIGELDTEAGIKVMVTNYPSAKTRREDIFPFALFDTLLVYPVYFESKMLDATTVNNAIIQHLNKRNHPCPIMTLPTLDQQDTESEVEMDDSVDMQDSDQPDSPDVGDDLDDPGFTDHDMIDDDDDDESSDDESSSSDATDDSDHDSIKTGPRKPPQKRRKPTK